jgi:hypothetical protein
MDRGSIPFVPPPPVIDEELYGFPALVREVQNAYPVGGTGAGRDFYDSGQGIRDYFSGAAPQTPTGSSGLTTAQKLAQQAQFQRSGRQDQNAVYENRLAQTGSYFPGGSSGSGGGRGIAGPNYGPYREALIGQADALNARIQAMYSQLAEQAGANVERISGIYGGAGEGIGNVYDSAAGNVAQAFGSAQQQATDQLARLGIEAAAPAVVNPMALSQAQAVSGLEQGRASGQAAAQRYGATAGGFGSQMAQVAQQQGTEMNSAILAALQQRLNDSLLMEEQGRQAAAAASARSGPTGPSFRDLLAQQELELKAAQIGADNRLSQQDKLITLWSDIRDDYDSDDEAQLAAEEALRRAQAFFG